MFEYRVERLGDWAIFYLAGEIGLRETAVLRKVIWETLTTEGIPNLIMHLGAVVTLENSVISLLVATKNLVSKSKGTLVLVELNPPHYQVFEQVNLHLYFDIRATVEAGLKDQLPVKRAEPATPAGKPES